MSQEVQLFFICPITDQDRLGNTFFKHYEYLQYMGQNKNAAFLSSLIHYAFNRNQQQIIDIIYQFLISFQNRSIYKQIAQIIKESISLLNPVEKFFSNFYKIDSKNEIAEKILLELCNQKRWLIGNNISYQILSNQFKIKISFQNYQESYGSYNSSIDIFQAQNKKFFYLIPQPLNYEIPSKYCFQCKTTSDYTTLDCQHKHCTFCLSKKSYFKCCNQSYSETYFQSKLEKHNNQKEYNKRSKALQDYYDNSKLIVQNTLYKNESNKFKNIQTDSLKECNLCYKKFKSELFIQQECNHQYCYDCMLLYQYPIFCLVASCKTKINYNEFQNYLLQFKKEVKVQEVIKQSEKIISQQNLNLPKEQQSILYEKCSKCNITLTYKLFQLKNCNHKICNTCLSRTEIQNVLHNFCLVSNCQQSFTLQEYNNYIQYLQDASKSEVVKKSVNNPQQTSQQFKCEKCQLLQNEDMQYILNCGHFLCQKCVINNQLYQRCCSISSQDQEYQNFRKNLKTNCDDCKNTFLIKNIFSLNCKHKFCSKCCQKIYSQSQPYRCLATYCKRIFILNQSENLITFLIDQDQEIQQNKEIQLKQEENVKQSLNEEPLIQKQSKEMIDNQVQEEAKIVEKIDVNNKNQYQDKKGEEEKSTSTQNSAIIIKEIQKVEYENLKKEEMNQGSKQKKQLIITNETNILNPFEKQKKQEKLKFLEADSVSEEQNEDQQFIRQQVKEIDLAQEKKSEFYVGNCTKCNQEFSMYNKKQEINCKSHQIGVCCILIKFKNCPQCEQGPQKSILIKQQLILPTNPIEIEFTFESTIIKPSLQNYYPTSYQQTQQRQYSNQDMENYRYNQSSAIKRNVTIDPFNKKVSESQQFIDDRSQIRNEIRNRNQLTQYRSPPPYIQQVHNTQHYDKYNFAKYNQGSLTGYPKREFLSDYRFSSGYPTKFP